VIATSPLDPRFQELSRRALWSFCSGLDRSWFSMLWSTMFTSIEFTWRSDCGHDLPQRDAVTRSGDSIEAHAYIDAEQ
jgi:hypothetical protein